MDLAVIVGDGLLAAGAVTAAVVGRRAIGQARDEAARAHDVGQANSAKLDALADASMNERIEGAVQEYAAAHPHIVGEAVMFEAMRDLFDAIIAANLDTPADRRRITRRAEQLADDGQRRRYVDSDIEETER